LKAPPREDASIVVPARLIWLATAVTRWFIWENDIGSIEVGNHADLAVLDRDYFTIPEDDIKRVRSVMTVVGGKVDHEDPTIQR
jgi:predicted amidohydrolase YtcJ